MKTEHGLFMCNWGALATMDGKVFVGRSAYYVTRRFLAPLEDGKGIKRSDGRVCAAKRYS